MNKVEQIVHDAVNLKVIPDKGVDTSWLKHTLNTLLEEVAVDVDGRMGCKHEGEDKYCDRCDALRDSVDIIRSYKSQ